MMKCMLLSAGFGARLRPLTERIPKPLIEIAGKPLIEYHLEKLKAAGCEDVVINLSYLGEMIQKRLGDGSCFGVHIEYSHEGKEPLDTAGGVVHALPLLDGAPFLVINADIWCDHALSFPRLANGKQAHLVLVDNPAHNPEGDFAYEHGEIYNTGKNFLTFSGIGIYNPALFKGCMAKKLALAPILRCAIDKELVSAEYFTGKWFDVGTCDRLQQARQYVSEAK